MIAAPCRACIRSAHAFVQSAGPVTIHIQSNESKTDSLEFGAQTLEHFEAQSLRHFVTGDFDPGDFAVMADPRLVETKLSHDFLAFVDHPQFLGRNRDGVAHGVRLVRDWKTQPPEELWRRKIGLGWSAFAVAGDYAVTQEQRGDKELVVCYELKTGQPRWIHEHDARLRDNQGGDGPRATPTIVEGRVYTLGGTGILDCLDGASGKNLWSRDTLADNQDFHRSWMDVS